MDHATCKPHGLGSTKNEANIFVTNQPPLGMTISSWEFKGNYPANATPPPANKALLRPY